MPSRNIVKQYTEDSYYHVYNRGVNKGKIFHDVEDYTVFLALLKRYLQTETAKDSYQRPYLNFHEDIDLIAYCLMPSYYHLLIYQKDSAVMEKLMRCVASSYTGYFNKKYKRTGHLFQGTYKASRIETDDHLLRTSRYIHVNPKNYQEWPYSSWPYFTLGWHADWVKQHKIFELFEGGDYARFVHDYVETKESLDELKKTLANS